MVIIVAMLGPGPKKGFVTEGESRDVIGTG